MGEMGKMDQNRPKKALSREGFATGGAEGAKSAKIGKMLSLIHI